MLSDCFTLICFSNEQESAAQDDAAHFLQDSVAWVIGVRFILYTFLELYIFFFMF